MPTYIMKQSRGPRFAFGTPEEYECNAMFEGPPPFFRNGCPGLHRPMRPGQFGGPGPFDHPEHSGPFRGFDHTEDSGPKPFGRLDHSGRPRRHGHPRHQRHDTDMGAFDSEHPNHFGKPEFESFGHPGFFGPPPGRPGPFGHPRSFGPPPPAHDNLGFFGPHGPPPRHPEFFGHPSPMHPDFFGPPMAGRAGPFGLRGHRGNSRQMKHMQQERDNWEFLPPINVSETANEYTIEAEVPSYTKDRIEIEVRDAKTIVIRGLVDPSEPNVSFEIEDDTDYGEARSEFSVSTNDTHRPEEKIEAKNAPYKHEEKQGNSGNKDGRKYLMREWTRGTGFTRTVKLCDEVDEESIKAVMKNGILTITIPKQPKAATRKITIA